MIPFHTLLTNAKADAFEQNGAGSVVTSAMNSDALNARATEAASSGLFPIEVAFVVLGCLMVSGMLLLMRESRIEARL